MTACARSCGSSSCTCPQQPHLGDEDHTVRTVITRSFVICGLFCGLSTWATLYNKYIFENVFPSSNCLLLVQNIVTVCALLIGRTLGVVSFTPSFGFGDVVCGLSYSINVMAGLWSLMFVNIAMFGALKRGTIMISWLIEHFFAPLPTTHDTLLPLVVMIVGAAVAGTYDLQFSLPGYLLAGLSCVAQGSSFELGRRMTVSNKGVCAVLLINSLCAIVLQLGLIVSNGEVVHLYPSKLSGKILFHFVLNSFSCLLMNYCVFLNCQVNSPLAHAVMGNAKMYLTTLIGISLFTTRLEVLGWIGLVGNCVGGAWFSYVKLQYQRAKAHAAAMKCQPV